MASSKLMIECKVYTLTTAGRIGMRDHPDVERLLNDGWSISACYPTATAGDNSIGAVSGAEFRFSWLLVLTRPK